MSRARREWCRESRPTKRRMGRVGGGERIPRGDRWRDGHGGEDRVASLGSGRIWLAGFGEEIGGGEMLKGAGESD